MTFKAFFPRHRRTDRDRHGRDCGDWGDYGRGCGDDGYRWRRRGDRVVIIF
ncbi:hypothetical protein ACO0M4_30955 [Streptomyces sp. RGM 3693]|uniref:hypothetical protein n=1 Tax=Streptomyces sp. RGM 3693 TaxID=3413284 RepID=UPI003D27E340